MIEMIYDRLSGIIASGATDDVNYILAKFVLQNVDEIPDTSIYTLAKKCGVSPASVTRFVQKCGFSSFVEFKDNCRDEKYARELSQNFHPIEDMPFADGYGEAERNADLEVIFSDIRSCISESSLKQAEEFTKELMESDDVVFFGISFVQIFAKHIVDELLNFGKYCGYTTDKDAILRNKRKNSMIVIVSMFGYKLPLDEDFYKQLTQNYDRVWLITQNPRGRILCKSIQMKLCPHSTSNYMLWMLLADEIVYMYKRLLCDKD